MMFYFASICIALLSNVWAQQCPNLASCIQTSTELCGDDAPHTTDRDGAGREGKHQMLTCVRTKLTEGGFDFEQFNSNSQQDENRCHPGMIFEACGIEVPEGGRKGGPRGGGRQAPPEHGRNNGVAGSRQGQRGKFGSKNNDEDGQEKQVGRPHRRGPKGGHHEKSRFLKGCRNEFSDDIQNSPAEGPRCRMRAVHQCMKDNRAEIEAAVACTLPEAEDRTCDPQVALAIQACKAEK